MPAQQAFDAPRGTYFLMDPDELVVIKDKDHPLFDPRGLEPPDPALVASIRVHGVDKAVKVIKDGGNAIVVDGRRRTIAAQEAKRLNKAEGGPIPKVKVELFRGDERSAVARMILGNFSPKEETLSQKADKAQKLHELNYSDEEIGVLFGVTAGTVKNWLTVRSFHPKAVETIAAGHVRMTDAIKALSKVERAEQPAAIAKLVEARPSRKKRKEDREATGSKEPVQVSPMRRFKKLLAFVANESTAPMPPGLVAILEWIDGQESDERLAHLWPDLLAFVETQGKGKKKSA